MKKLIVLFVVASMFLCYGLVNAFDLTVQGGSAKSSATINGSTTSAAISSYGTQTYFQPYVGAGIVGYKSGFVSITPAGGGWNGVIVRSGSSAVIRSTR